jgi:hypothetical protein
VLDVFVVWTFVVEGRGVVFDCCCHVTRFVRVEVRRVKRDEKEQELQQERTNKGTIV